MGRPPGALEPSLSDDVVGAVLFPDDAHLVPAAFVTGLGRAAAALGVRVRPGTEVLALETAGRRVRRVETTRGMIEADQVVLAAGSWSPGLARTLGLPLPIQPAKGYSLTFARPPHRPTFPLLLGEARFAVTPMGETLRFAGRSSWRGWTSRSTGGGWRPSRAARADTCAAWTGSVCSKSGGGSGRARRTGSR